MIKYKKKSAGFTLIGVIATLFIISVGLAGIIGLVNLSLKSSTTSKMRLIASGLAQEGVEIVRDMRNSNIEWDNWYSSISNGDYRVQYKDNPPVLMFPSDVTPLKIDEQGFYQYDSGNDSPFYRKVNFYRVSANELKLTVEVKWYSRGQWASLIVEDHLWNWK